MPQPVTANAAAAALLALAGPRATVNGVAAINAAGAVNTIPTNADVTAKVVADSALATVTNAVTDNVFEANAVAVDAAATNEVSTNVVSTSTVEAERDFSVVFEKNHVAAQTFLQAVTLRLFHGLLFLVEARPRAVPGFGSNRCCRRGQCCRFSQRCRRGQRHHVGYSPMTTRRLTATSPVRCSRPRALGKINELDGSRGGVHLEHPDDEVHGRDKNKTTNTSHTRVHWYIAVATCGCDNSDFCSGHCICWSVHARYSASWVSAVVVKPSCQGRGRPVGGQHNSH